MPEEFAITLHVAPSSVTVTPGTTDPPPSSPVQVVPPQGGPAVVVVAAPAADSTPSMDDLMADHATSGLGKTPTSVASPQPLVLETTLLTPHHEGEPNVARDETPTSFEAARCLVRFLDEVCVEREPPLIASPPRQKMPARRLSPVWPRNSQIVA